MTFPSAENGDDAAVAVDADAVTRLDLGGGLAGADDGRHAVLAGHDRRVRHRAADVGDGGGDLAEHPAPPGSRHRAGEDLALTDLADVVDVHQDAGHTLDPARGGRVPADDVL